MKKIAVLFLSLFFVCLCSSAVLAASTLYDWAFNVNGITYENSNGDSMPTTGLLNTQGLGTLTWSTSAAGSHSFIAFFDYEINEETNTYCNEYGVAVNTAGVTQSWEIDEPGFRDVNPGDIYQNVLKGLLDNYNAVPAGSEDDVSWALGWNFILTEGESATIELILSATAPTSGFYLAHTDPDSNETIYFSSTCTITPVPVPATLVLLSSGLVGLMGFGRKKLGFRK